MKTTLKQWSGSIRFKIVLSLLIAVIIPISASIFFFKKGVNRAYSIALNRDVEEALKVSVESQKQVINLMKKNFKFLSAFHAKDEGLIDAINRNDKDKIRSVLLSFLDQEPSLIKAEIKNGDEREVLSISRGDSNYPDTIWRRFETSSTITSTAGKMSLVELYIVPWESFRTFERTGKTYATFEASMKAAKGITGLYSKMYIILVGLSVVMALTIGYLYSSRYSRRIKKIARSAAQIGKGNLEVRINDSSNDEIGQLGRNFDAMVSELKESRERINYLQKISAWQEIARILAHEIKNPLTPIQLSVQQLKSKYSGTDKNYIKILEESTQIVEEEIESLRTLVSEFSNFARLPGVNPRLCQLNEVMRDMLTGTDKLCMEKGVILNIDFGRDDVPVCIDRMLFKRAIDNLIINALDAIERKREKNVQREGLEKDQILIKTYTEKNRNFAVIEVADSGEGVNEKEGELIFLPYFTRRKGGTGLGLPVVKKIILEHGGEIKLEKGKHPVTNGACFKIRLPIEGYGKSSHPA